MVNPALSSESVARVAPVFPRSPSEQAREAHQVELADTVAKMVGLYKSVENTAMAFVETCAERCSRLVDLGLGAFLARQANGVASAPPLDTVLRTGLSARCFMDLALVWPLTREAAAASGDLLLNPSSRSVTTLAERVAQLAQVFTRVAYLGAMLGMIAFPPSMHIVNITATGVAGVFGALGQLQIYRICLKGKEAAIETEDAARVETAMQGQINALLKTAANLALIVFAAISFSSTTWSMIPLTAAAAGAFAVSAGFSFLGSLHERWLQKVDPKVATA